MNSLTLTPKRPHVFRAFYDWLVENDLTPHLVVDATLPRVEVPQDYVKDGQIVLNIAPRAVADFFIENHRICFSARFSGQALEIVVPMYAVLAIYARENGAGTMFEPEPSYEAQIEELVKQANKPIPSIGLVDSESLTEVEKAETEEEVDVDTETKEEVKSEKPKAKKPKKKGPPSLKVVK